MTVRDQQPDAIVSFTGRIPPDSRSALLGRLSNQGWQVSEGLEIGTRAPDPITVAVVVTLILNGFFQRYGEMAAERVATLVRSVLSWAGGHQEDLDSPDSRVSFIEIRDRDSGITFKFRGEEPDAAIEALRVIVSARNGEAVSAVEWDGRDWR